MPPTAVDGSWNPIAKYLIILGVICIVTGITWQFAPKFLGLGKLPGDISIEGKNVKFYFPIVSCLLLSAIISLILWIIRYFK